MKPTVSAIIIHWNNDDILQKYLAKIGNNPDLEIIVVDNNSDKKPLWISNKYPYIKLIKNSINEGYAKAANIGASHAQGEWLLFMNDDLDISWKQIDKMRNYLIQRDLSVGSPIPDNDDYRKPIPTPLSLLAEFTPFRHILHLNYFREKTLFGGCVLITAKVFNKIGGWSEDYFLWFEDSDLTRRLLNAGYKIGWVPINVIHIGGRSFARLAENERKNLFFNAMDIYAKKYFSIPGRIIVKLIKVRYLKTLS